MANARERLDKNWTDEELEAMGYSGDPDDWSLEQQQALQALYDKAHPEFQRPADIAYDAAYDPLSMSIQDKFDKRGLEKFREEALRDGPSKYAGIQLQQAGLEQMLGEQGAAKKSAAQRAEAFDQLAMSGGAGAGAKERLAGESAKNALSMAQNATMEGARNRLQILGNDEKNRIQQLGMLPGMEVQALDPMKFDIGQQVAEKNRKNQFSMDMWKTKMQEWGAANTARAQEESGK